MKGIKKKHIGYGDFPRTACPIVDWSGMLSFDHKDVGVGSKWETTKTIQ